MISKRITGRNDGKSSALDALRYGAGLKLDRDTGVYLDKSHRTRFGGFGLVENGVYFNQDIQVMAGIVDLAALEMQTNCDLNTQVELRNKLSHFIFSFDQDRPSEAVLRDTEDSTLSALKLYKNHFASFLHNDNGHWHLHVFAGRIEKDEPHRGNSLWRDKTIRDRVCREIEIRHGLNRDNGLHRIDVSGQIVEIPVEERRARREKEKAEISDVARKFETHSGEKSFQAWCAETRIGDRLKHSKSWQQIHEAAAAYNCQIKPKGAGFVLCPIGEKGGIQLSKIGLKNLSANFGEFEPFRAGPTRQHDQRLQEYKPEPTKPAVALFEKWTDAKSSHKAAKLDALTEFRKTALVKRLDIRGRQKIELVEIRSTTTGHARVSAISITKMQHVAELAELAEATRIERSALYKNLAIVAPGATFRDYLVQQAQVGDETALVMVRRYGLEEATKVSIRSETLRLKIVAAFSGPRSKSIQRLPIKHRVERNGTVIFDLGGGRIVTDSATAKQIQLNAAAANDPAAIETSLKFAASRFGNTLTLIGTQEFQHLAVETSVRKGLFIKFADPVLEQYRNEFSAKTSNSHKVKENQYVKRTQKNSDQSRAPAPRRDRLQNLPQLNVVSKSTSTQMLLQGEVPGGLAEPNGARTQGQHPGLRWIDHDQPGGGRTTASQPSATSHPAGPGVAGSSTSVGAGPEPVFEADGSNRTMHYSNSEEPLGIETAKDQKLAAHESAKREATPKNSPTPPPPELKADHGMLTERAGKRHTLHPQNLVRKGHPGR